MVIDALMGKSKLNTCRYWSGRGVFSAVSNTYAADGEAPLHRKISSFLSGPSFQIQPNILLDPVRFTKNVSEGSRSRRSFRGRVSELELVYTIGNDSERNSRLASSGKQA